MPYDHGYYFSYFGKDKLSKKKLNPADSFEYELFNLVLSENFDHICSAMLPSKIMQETGAA